MIWEFVLRLRISIVQITSTSDTFGAANTSEGSSEQSVTTDRATVKGQSGGVSVAGRIGSIIGDIVGRDNITLNLSLIEDTHTAATLKASLDLIQHVSSLLNDVTL